MPKLDLKEENEDIVEKIFELKQIRKGKILPIFWFPNGRKKGKK